MSSTRNIFVQNHLKLLDLTLLHLADDPDKAYLFVDTSNNFEPWKSKKKLHDFLCNTNSAIAASFEKSGLSYNASNYKSHFHRLVESLARKIQSKCNMNPRLSTGGINSNFGRGETSAYMASSTSPQRSIPQHRPNARRADTASGGTSNIVQRQWYSGQPASSVEQSHLFVSVPRKTSRDHQHFTMSFVQKLALESPQVFVVSVNDRRVAETVHDRLCQYTDFRQSLEAAGLKYAGSTSYQQWFRKQISSHIVKSIRTVGTALNQSHNPPMAHIIYDELKSDADAMTSKVATLSPPVGASRNVHSNGGPQQGYLSDAIKSDFMGLLFENSDSKSENLKNFREAAEKRFATGTPMPMWCWICSTWSLQEKHSKSWAESGALEITTRNTRNVSRRRLRLLRIWLLID
jgi:hypothetical protein